MVFDLDDDVAVSIAVGVATGPDSEVPAGKVSPSSLAPFQAASILFRLAVVADQAVAFACRNLYSKTADLVSANVHEPLVKAWMSS